MPGGTLFVSRAENLFSHYKKLFEGAYGYKDISFTGADKDGLNMVINESKPRMLMMDSWFYQAATSYMTGELLGLFPRLNIAIVSFHDYPPSLAAWFIWHGAKSYINFWDGEDEFKKGVTAARDGRRYVSPLVQTLIESRDEWPDTKCKVTKRMMECLILLCCGFVPERIGQELHLSRKTVNNHLDRLYDTFHARNREEMVAMAWTLRLVTPGDIRFIDKGPLNRKLPAWAAVKKETDRRILKYGA